MSEIVLLVDFFTAIETDPRVNSRHISLYVSLFQFWVKNGANNPLQLFGKEVMGICKISASSTYHKTLRDLYAFGYIQYEPSFNHSKGSIICLTKIKVMKKVKPFDGLF